MSTGDSQTFVASLGGTDTSAVSWTTTGGTITSDGVFTAPSSAGTCLITATSTADSSKTATATITVLTSSTVKVSISPSRVVLVPNEEQTFTATVTGSSNSNVTWITDYGTITQDGVFTAPDTKRTCTIRAISKAYSSAVANAVVTMSDTRPTITLDKLGATVGEGESTTFTATVSNTSNKSVTWTATGGTITSTGVYTAPTTAGSYTVTATCVADTTRTASATVTVNQISVSITPTTATLVTGASRYFTAMASNANNTSVTWTCSAGTVTSAGNYTAPTTAGTYTVTAASVSNPARTATATVTVVDATVIEYDFESGVPGLWYPQTAGTTPSGRHFLGLFGGTDGAQLTISSLTTHTKLKIEFDLYVVGNWDGVVNNSAFNVLIGSTNVWTRSFSNIEDDKQTYPDGDEVAPGTSRTEANTLGYYFTPEILYYDTVYRVSFTTDHTDDSAVLHFTGNLLGTAATRGWGIDNVKITAVP